MIFPGYIAVGKTFTSGKDNGFIDLDSYYFKSGNKVRLWYEEYCELAIKLSESGYNVFTSCHDEVLKYLSLNYDKILVIYPSLELKSSWIKRTLKRYKETGREKDRRAYERVRRYFDQDVKGAKKYGLKVLFLDENSDLESLCLEKINKTLGLDLC